MIERGGFSVEVPGNVSRYFKSPGEARRQPLGKIVWAWDSKDPLLFNKAFNPNLVKHDMDYCTTSVDTDGRTCLPTQEYFNAAIAPLINDCRSIIDIGCGQGEFVNWLRSNGWRATGYDPVLRRTGPHLIRRYWTPEEMVGDLYIMRCVLPHIARPWEFLDLLAETNDKALVLVEFQRLEYILEESLWFQFSHDHVNQFQLPDFSDRFSVIAHGQFAGSEWEWVLLCPSVRSQPRNRPFRLESSLSNISQCRQRAIEKISALDSPVAIWGAAGKGVVLAHALSAAGVEDICMIDSDPNKEGLFVEASGSRILSPSQAFSALHESTTVLVANPRHVSSVSQHLGNHFRVTSAADWGKP